MGLVLCVLAVAPAAGGGTHEQGTDRGSIGPASTVPAGATTATRFNWKAFSGTTIRFIADKHPWVDVVRPYLPEFESLTGIKVDMSVFPEDQVRTKLTIELLSGTSDVDTFMIMPGQDLAHYTAEGWMEPLDRYLSSPSLLWPDYDAADLFQSALNAGVADGRNYTIPIQLETSLLAYNKDILSRYGVAVPTTMDDLVAAAKQIYEGSHGQIYGITMRGKKAAATSQWVDFLHSFGGTWLDGSGRSVVDSREAVAATELYSRLLRLYGPKSAPSNSWYESISIFMQQKAAMIYDASVFKAEYENPETSRVAGHVGYAVIPGGPAGSVPHISTWSLGIYSGSARKGAAWLFIQWATSKDLELRALLKGIPSARTSAWESPTFQREDPTPEWTRASIASYNIASPAWNPPVVPVAECRDSVGNAIVSAILGEDVQAALNRAAGQMDEIIAASR